MRAGLLIGCLFLVVSCQRTPAPAPTPVGVQPAALPAPGARPSDPWKDLAGALPADANFVLTADAGDLIEFASSWFGFLPVKTLQKNILADLGGVSRRLLGVDLTKARSVAVFVSLSDMSAGLLVRGSFGDTTLVGQQVTIGGTLPAVAFTSDLAMARIQGDLALGTPAGLVKLQAVLTGKARPLSDSDLGKQHAGLRQRLKPRGAALVVTGDLGPLVDYLGPIFGTGGTLGFGGLTLGPGAAARLMVAGSPEALGVVEGAVRGALKELEAAAAKMEASMAESNDPAEALASVFGAHTVRYLLGSLTIEVQNGWLDAKVDTKLSTAPAVLMASLAAVAIPAFVKYQRKALTIEAIENLDVIYRAAGSHFTTPAVLPSGEPAPCAFPDDVAIGPVGSPCDHPDDKYPGNPADWTHPTWQALNFSLNQPHYFRYAFDSEGTGANAKFTASAHADLDCDGVWSTFERYGYAEETTDGTCQMRGNSAFYKNLETE